MFLTSLRNSDLLTPFIEYVKILINRTKNNGTSVKEKKGMNSSCSSRDPIR